MNVLKMSKRACLSLLMAAVMLLVWIPVGTVVGAASRGDVNGDGAINVLDAIALYNAVAGGGDPLTPEQEDLGDVNGDGAANVLDAIVLYNIAGGLGGEIVDPDPNEIDLLVYSNLDTASTQNATVTEREDGGWLIEASAAGQVVINGPGTYNADKLDRTHIAIASDVPFTITFYDEANDKTMTSGEDFYPDFGTSYKAAIPAGTYQVSLWTNGCYTYNNDPLPDTVQFSKITIAPQGAGNIVIGHMALHQDDTCTCDVADLTLPGGAPAVTVSIGSATASVGDIVTVPVSISDDHYMINGRIFITYDPAVLELQPASSSTTAFATSYNKTVLGEGMGMFLSPEDGKANFVFISQENVGLATGGDIYTVSFKILAAAPNGTELGITIPEMRSNDDPNAANSTDLGYATNVAVQSGTVTTV